MNTTFRTRRKFWHQEYTCSW